MFGWQYNKETNTYFIDFDLTSNSGNFIIQTKNQGITIKEEKKGEAYNSCCGGWGKHRLMCPKS